MALTMTTTKVTIDESRPNQVSQDDNIGVVQTIIRAHPGNSEPVWFGKQGIELVQYGMPVNPDQVIILDGDLKLSLLYVDGPQDNAAFVTQTHLVT